MEKTPELATNIYQPEFFRLNKVHDKEKYQLLLQLETLIFIYDEIEGQLRELIKCLNPTLKKLIWKNILLG